MIQILRREIFVIVVVANGTKMVVTKMNAATFSCKNCKIQFQLIGISTRSYPMYCPYCGNGSIEPVNLTFS
jgi:hypothetical protein